MRRLLTALTASAFLYAAPVSSGPQEYLAGFDDAEMFLDAVMITGEKPVAYKDLKKQIHFTDYAGEERVYTGFKFPLQPGIIWTFPEEGDVPVYNAHIELVIGPYVCEDGKFELLVSPKVDSRLEREVTLIKGNKRQEIKVNDPVFDNTFPCGKYDISSKILYKGEVFDERVYSFDEWSQ